MFWFWGVQQARRVSRRGPFLRRRPYVSVWLLHRLVSTVCESSRSRDVLPRTSNHQNPLHHRAHPCRRPLWALLELGSILVSCSELDRPCMSGNAGGAGGANPPTLLRQPPPAFADATMRPAGGKTVCRLRLPRHAAGLRRPAAVPGRARGHRRG